MFESSVLGENLEQGAGKMFEKRVLGECLRIGYRENV